MAERGSKYCKTAMVTAYDDYTVVDNLSDEQDSCMKIVWTVVENVIEKCSHL